MNINSLYSECMLLVGQVTYTLADAFSSVWDWFSAEALRTFKRSLIRARTVVNKYPALLDQEDLYLRGKK